MPIYVLLTKYLVTGLHTDTYGILTFEKSVVYF